MRTPSSRNRRAWWLSLRGSCGGGGLLRAGLRRGSRFCTARLQGWVRVLFAKGGKGQRLLKKIEERWRRADCEISWVSPGGAMVANQPAAIWVLDHRSPRYYCGNPRLEV